MTQEQFDNQQWYKNMPVLLSKEHKKPVFVKGVNFGTNQILVGSAKEGDYFGRWLEYDNIVVLEPDPKRPSALDLIAQEREKQISKGYTVEHDAQMYPNCQLVDIAADLIYNNWHQVPEGWSKDYWKILCDRPYKDRVRIAATWMARELETIIYIESKEV